MRISGRSVWIWAALTTACGAPAESGQAASSEDGGMQMDGGSAGASIRITSRQASLAGVTFAVAREAPLTRTVRAVATVVPDERRLGVVNARVDGWVERLYVEETGRWIAAGEALLELYAPDLVTAQEELLLAMRLRGTAAGDSLVAAARRRLAYWEISDEQIARLEETGVVRRTLTLRSPFPGHVLEKHVIEGQRIRAGEDLFRVADLSNIWIEPAIFERDLPLIHVGQRAEVTFEALPGERFEGRLTFIHPVLSERTRTVRVRLELPNPGVRIKPMMYGTVRIEASAPPAVVVPLTAVLPTGDRDLAFVVRGDRVVPQEVTVGDRGDTEVTVLEGIAVGDTVVASATFLFDSESSLAAAMQGIMLNMGMGLDMGGMDMGGMDMPDTVSASGRGGAR
ncbi:MAG: efflux RND transporter periplasmic adaptor subunit [Gemmatimonadota bacterium]